MSATDDLSPFWRFSLRFYRRPGVADACLRLQDEAGADVNLLLFLLWLASSRRSLSGTEIEAVEHKVAPWREQVVIPLRAIRRTIKTPPAAIAPAAAETYRSKVKALELEAERLQQEALYDLAQRALVGHAAPSPEAAARANIAAYQGMSQRPFPADAVETIVAAFMARSEDR